MCICHLITLVAPGTQIRQSGDQLICRDMQVFVLGKSVQMHTVKKKQLPEMPKDLKKIMRHIHKTRPVYCAITIYWQYELMQFLM